MSEKVVVTCHPRHGYIYDIKTTDRLVSAVPDLGIHRRSVFDEVKTPAYKKQHNVFRDYSIGRSSPVWNVSQAAKQALSNDRLAQLSQPKKCHSDYVPCRPVQTTISPAAQNASASERIESLSTPKERPNIEAREWTVKKGALAARATERVLELSHAKGVPLGFTPDKIEVWEVSKPALKARASKRINYLALPIKRAIATNLPNPDAFVVKKAAQNAKCSDRLTDLAQPIIRG